MRPASYVPNAERHLWTSSSGPRRTEFTVDLATMLSLPQDAMGVEMSSGQVIPDSSFLGSFSE